MSLQAGTQLGPYRVTAQIGAGGMGEVYRATDTHLGRDVALKVLPQAFAADADRLARIEREARTLAALNHPNVAQIYGLEHASDGSRALVMELVDGPTLADRIAQGPLPLDEALTIANQIASALEAAHGQGIIHRDLKPANIKLRDDGTVKVLDFGLAKAVDLGGGSNSALSLSPTITTPALTQMGVILGTAAYMSPEQARGRGVDRRADIWSFGCVVYEMLTGRRAFEGEGVTDTLGAILHKDPAWDALDPKIPARIRMVLQRCLHKDPRQRLHDIADVTLAMAGAFETTGAGQTSLAGRASPLAPWKLGAIALVGAGLGGLVVWATIWSARTTTPPATPVRLVLTTPEDPPVRLGNNAGDVAITPDGRHIVYGASAAGGGLVVRAIDRLETAVLATDQQAFQPIVSPDGAWVAYNDQSDRTIKKMSIQGGPAITLASTPAPIRGASWGDDGRIVFATSDPKIGLLRVADGGGKPEVLTTPDSSKGEVDHQWPQVLPGAQAALFSRQLQSPGAARAEIALLNLKTKEQRVLIPEGTNPQYVPSGHIVYGVNGTLRAVAFDLASLQVRGNPVPVVEGVLTKNSGAADFSVAANGSLVYIKGAASVDSGRPVWVSRDGHEEGSLVQTELPAPEYPRLSPDGTRVAIVVAGDVWVYDVNGRPPIKLTFNKGNYSPAWTPDSRRIVFESATPQGLFVIAADGSEQKPQQVSAAGHFHPIAVIPTGGDFLAVEIGSQSASGADIVKWQPGQPDARQPVVQTAAREGFEGASLSPDGRWLAYTSDQTGQLEVWVRPYPGPGAPQRVSPNGGIEPLWSRRGHELYYIEGTRLMAVAVTTGATFTFKPPTMLFENPHPITTQPPSYDVAADGRFLMIKSSASQARTSPQVVVVLNWLDELRRLVPGK